ncbi:hematopoietic progenitor cell antigen CD34 [Pleuronectes platessa]|uniref:hematopoietic progenitor cell antigen CD34 n=1 Tax=Pleuronectes platessa TaxID=8262 RepID=UPI00232A77B8|nr:hematopoietic progenitor cell antigen CD34 [Pleuronectes platessa]
MAASCAKRNEEPRKMLALALLLAASLLNGGVMAQVEEIVAATAPSLDAPVRGDMLPQTTPEPEYPQVMVFPTPGPLQPTEKTTAATDEAGNAVNSSPAAPEEAAGEGTQTTAEAHTDKPQAEVADTPAPMPSRGDGPGNVPGPAPNDDVVCVTKEAVQNKNAVSLKLKASSNCKDTKQKIESVVQELCGEDCKLELYQEDNSDEILVSGKYVEDDIAGMANKFNNDNIKDKVDVEEAHPHWGKNSKLVLVSLLLTGLLLAAALLAGYYFKTHRKSSKGVRLAESFQVDEENQANTLVSVAPLPQEPLNKPTPNGEAAPENGTSQTPTTNGHSQTPVADTEM